MNNKNTTVKGEKKVQNKIAPKNKKTANSPKKSKKKVADIKAVNIDNKPVKEISVTADNPKNGKNKNLNKKPSSQKKKSSSYSNKKKGTGGRITSKNNAELLLDEISEGISVAREKDMIEKAKITKKSDKTNQVKKEVKKPNDHDKKLKVISLGGLAEIGKNITVFEYGEDIVIIDAGLAFPDDDMLGIDLVIPDFSYLVQNAHKIRGLLITHGHEDHIGAVSYLLSQIDIPVYGTRLSLGIIEGKLDENRPPFEPRLYTVEASDKINLGVFRAEFIHVNHSIADACAICLKTPVGNVFHTGDFKIDVSPIDGNMIDLTRIGEIGREGVELLLCESTNAERGGFTPSERTVGGSLDRIFSQSEDKRLIIATFSSNVHRVQQIINASAKYKRKVAVLGRSMTNVLGAAVELGYMDLPDDCLIDISEIKKYRPGEITLITTGSQGEPMSALYRIAFSEHDKVKLSSNDIVVLSSSAIPGNEKLVGKIINALIKNGVKVVNDSAEDVHVSGHACKEEIKLLISLLRPKYYMPIHGEYRHLYANKEIAEFMGIPSSNIFISEIGKVLELGKKGCAFNGTVPAGKVLIDGSGVGDIGSVVLRDRKHLAEDGLVVIVASINLGERLIFSGPDIVSRGFVYVKESTDLVARTKAIADNVLNKLLDRGVNDHNQLKTAIKDEVSKFIFKETKRRPMILPILMEV